MVLATVYTGEVPAPAPPVRGRRTGGTPGLKAAAAVLAAALAYWAAKEGRFASGAGPDGGVLQLLSDAGAWLGWGWAGGEGRMGGSTGGERALMRPLCAAAAALEQKAWSELLTEAAQRACATLTRAQDLTFEPFEPKLLVWQQRALPAFVRVSLLVAAVLIPCARYLLDLLFQRLGRSILPAVGCACDADCVTFGKWREACWKLFTYGALTAMGLLSCWAEAWVHETELLWRGWPDEHAHSPALRLWYAVEMGLYLYAVFDLLLWEAVRGDYYAMILHHASTLALLGGSFYYGFLRAGAMLLMLNDFVDFWFEGAKLAKYAKAEAVSTAFFLAFVASWALLRQLYCPFSFAASMLVDGWGLVEQYGPSTRHIAIWAAFNVLVWSLVLLHTYWFFFLLQKIRINVRVHVTIKVVDRRPGVAVEDVFRKPEAASPRVGLEAHTAHTLLEED